MNKQATKKKDELMETNKEGKLVWKFRCLKDFLNSPNPVAERNNFNYYMAGQPVC